MMSSDDYHVQDVYRYSRKSYKNRRPGTGNESVSPAEDTEGCSGSPRRDEINFERFAELPTCSCDPDPEADIASILHKKCPVISLAQQQLQQLLDGTDQLICESTRRCRSFYDLIYICKDVLTNGNPKCQMVLLALVALGFWLGVLFGAASCGTYLGYFNSPILTCIDSYFAPDVYSDIQQTYRSIT